MNGDGLWRFGVADGAVTIRQRDDTAAARATARVRSSGRSRSPVSRDAGFAGVPIEDTPPND